MEMQNRAAEGLVGMTSCFHMHGHAWYVGWVLCCVGDIVTMLEPVCPSMPAS